MDKLHSPNAAAIQDKFHISAQYFYILATSYNHVSFHVSGKSKILVNKVEKKYLVTGTV